MEICLSARASDARFVESSTRKACAGSCHSYFCNAFTASS